MTIELQQLQSAIQELYIVFGDYQLQEQIHACSGCVSDEDQARIISKPLLDLTNDDLYKYAFKAMTTWGDSNDFRRFLPRLFELQAYSVHAFYSVEVLFGKLFYGEWRTWPIHEQRVIEKYFQALWKYVIITFKPEGYSYCDDYLCGIGRSIDDLRFYLHIWQQTVKQLSLDNLLAFIIQNENQIQNKRLKNTFWKDREKQVKQVIGWLYSPQTLAHYKQLVVPDPEQANVVLEIIQYLAQFQQGKNSKM